MQRHSRPPLHLLQLRQIGVAKVASVAGGDGIYEVHTRRTGRGGVSAMGQTRKKQLFRVKSAFTADSDIFPCPNDVGYGPLPEVA
jgi:hypothetical protein